MIQDIRQVMKMFAGVNAPLPHAHEQVIIQPAEQIKRIVQQHQQQDISVEKIQMVLENGCQQVAQEGPFVIQQQGYVPQHVQKQMLNSAQG